MTARIPTRSRRQSMDWSLVLLSQGIESTIEHSEEAGWGLAVSAQDFDRALDTLRQYRIENRHWPWLQRIRSGIRFDWGSLFWVVLLAFFFWMSGRNAAVRDAGLMDSAAVSHGQWWRLSTAIFLHANLGHLAANASIGLVLLGLTMGRYGTGIGLLAAYLTGVGGNLATWMIYPDHRSLGASGMVMGCLGLLGAQSPWLAWRNPGRLKYLATGIVAGIMLFVLMGLSPGTDVVAHLGGFVAGLVLGFAQTPFPKIVKSTSANLMAALLFCLLVSLTWWLAMMGASSG